MTGVIAVEFVGKSNFLSSMMPHRVLDASLTEVASSQGYSRYPLDAGLYVVEAVTLDGDSDSRLVRVREGETEVVRFEGHEDRPKGERTLPFALLSATNCTAVEEDERHITFGSDGSITATPEADFERVGAPPVTVSLPVHNRTGSPGDSAIVVAGAGDIPVVQFHPARRVASAIDHMMGRGSMLEAEGVFDQALELLLHKYQDPPAAALGALTLHKLGRLGERPDWLRNLANSFAWLPDGRVLRAAFLRDQDDADRAEGLDVLLEEPLKRPLYSDGLSLWIELLRRWPGEDRLDERRRRSADLGRLAASADLGATFLTTTTG